MFARDLDLKTGILQNFSCSLRCFRKEIVIERIRPEHHFSSVGPTCALFMLLKPLTKCLGSKFWNGSLERHTRREFGGMAQSRCLSDKIDQSRPQRSRTRPLIDKPKGISVPRAQPA